MSDIFIHNKKIDSIFQLLGEKENDISLSIGWALAKAHKFLKIFITSTIGWQDQYTPEDIKISLQHYEEKRGLYGF